MAKRSSTAGLMYDAYDDGVVVGKGMAALKKSRDIRSALVHLFGGEQMLPRSVMEAAKIDPQDHDDEWGQKRTYHNTAPLREELEQSNLPSDVKNSFIVSGKGASAGALSMFYQDVGRTLLLMYSEPGDVVVDPFAGHNSRMDLCVLNNRGYLACDLCTEFMQHNSKRADELRRIKPSLPIDVRHQDSRKLPFENEIGDFTITSPPYYNVEKYGEEPEQLGKCPTYGHFLDDIQLVMAENYRCLRPGAFAVWCVNDFRKNGVFHSYHTDTILRMREVGFVHHDLMVVRFKRAFGDIFLRQTVERKVLPKCHEYALVFRKPDAANAVEEAAP